MSWPSMLFVKQQMVDAAANAVNVCREPLFAVRLAASFARSAEERALFLGRVITFAGQNLQIVVGHIDFDFAKFSVVRRVRWIVAERVLAAQFLGNLIERFGKVLFGIDRNGAAAGFFRDFVRHAAVPAAKM